MTWYYRALIGTFVFLGIVLFLGYSFNKGKIRRTFADIKGYSRVCIDGVNYLQFPSGVTVEYTQNGMIRTCK